jgi:hypothetical protein
MFKNKKLDSIVGSFNKTLNDLKLFMDNNHKEHAQLTTDIEVKEARKRVITAENERAASIHDKIVQLIS